MSLDLDKLVSSERSYQLNVRDTIDIIKDGGDVDVTLKKIVLFCKQAFSVNGNQRKKYLCLFLVRDIFENLQSDNYERMLEQNIAQKLLKTIMMQGTGNIRESRAKDEENEEYSERLIAFAVETVIFWSKKNSSGKSAFRDIYEEIKKLKIPFPKNFKYYNPELLLQLWKDKVESAHGQQNLALSPVLIQLTEKFNQAKATIESKISDTLIHDDDLNLRQIQKEVKQFLLMFFSRMKLIEDDQSLDRGTVVVYYHIINAFYKKISNKQYIPTSDMISLTRESFEGVYSSTLSSINKMDIVQLAGTQKFNTLSIFERIHKRIEEQEKQLPSCQISLEYEEIERKRSMNGQIAYSRTSM